MQTIDRGLQAVCIGVVLGDIVGVAVGEALQGESHRYAYSLSEKCSTAQLDQDAAAIDGRGPVRRNPVAAADRGEVAVGHRQRLQRQVFKRAEGQRPGSTAKRSKVPSISWLNPLTSKRPSAVRRRRTGLPGSA